MRTEVNQEIVVFALRYAIGRQTAAVPDTIAAVKQAGLDPHLLASVRRDVREHLQRTRPNGYSDGGDFPDIRREWVEFARWLDEHAPAERWDAPTGDPDEPVLTARELLNLLTGSNVITVNDGIVTGNQDGRHDLTAWTHQLRRGSDD